MILIDTNELCKALDMDSASIWRLVRQGYLPQPYSITGSALAFWRADEVFAWARLPLSAAVLIWGQLTASGRAIPRPEPQRAAATLTYV